MAKSQAVLNQGQFAPWFNNAPLSEELAADGEVLDMYLFSHGPDGHLKIPHLWPGQNPPATVEE
jgi:hypothetical protein